MKIRYYQFGTTYLNIPEKEQSDYFNGLSMDLLTFFGYNMKCVESPNIRKLVLDLYSPLSEFQNEYYHNRGLSADEMYGRGGVVEGVMMLQWPVDIHSLLSKTGKARVEAIFSLFQDALHYLETKQLAEAKGFELIVAAIREADYSMSFMAIKQYCKDRKVWFEIWVRWGLTGNRFSLRIRHKKFQEEFVLRDTFDNLTLFKSCIHFDIGESLSVRLKFRDDFATYQIQLTENETGRPSLVRLIHLRPIIKLTDKDIVNGKKDFDPAIPLSHFPLEPNNRVLGPFYVGMPYAEALDIITRYGWEYETSTKPKAILKISFLQLFFTADTLTGMGIYTDSPNPELADDLGLQWCWENQFQPHIMQALTNHNPVKIAELSDTKVSGYQLGPFLQMIVRHADFKLEKLVLMNT